MSFARKSGLGLAAVSALALAPLAAAQQPAKVTVTVNNVQSDAGTIRGALCTDRAAFGVSPCPDYAVVVPAKKGSVELVFNNVPPGTYAFAVWHDENDNRTTDIFTEAFAFGNEAKSLPPVFDEATFKVTGDMQSSTTLFRMVQ